MVTSYMPAVLPRELTTPGPHPDLRDGLARFGQFVGDWKMRVRFFNPAGEPVYAAVSDLDFFARKYDLVLAPSRANTGRRDSVSVQIIFAGGRGWTGIASHWGLRGRSCVVFVGMNEELHKIPITPADPRTPTEEGVPACDSPPAPNGSAPAPGPQTPATAPQPAQPPGRQ
jgi:hypothetical protein